MATGKELAVVKAHGSTIAWPVYSPADRTLASCSRDGTIKLWDIPTFGLRSGGLGHAQVARACDVESEPKALAALQSFQPVVTFDENMPDKRVVGIRFRPNISQKVTDEDLIHLKNLPHLRSLDVGSQKISDRGLEHLIGLTELEGLDVRWNKLTAPAVVRVVKGMTRLQRLGLSGVPICDKDLLELNVLSDLRDLNLRATLVTDNGLAHLRAFRALRHLSLMSTKISDAGLERLKVVADLEDLDLDRTPITDAGLKHLYGLSNLRRLQLHGTRVSDEAVGELKQALPKLQVSLDTNAKVRREQVRGGIVFPAEKRIWLRITGKAKVINAHTLLFEDGTEVDLNGGIEAPELEQQGMIGDSLYPCGKEAAKFLRNLIGDQTVKCLAGQEHLDGKKVRIASAFVGETNLNIELVRNGWAVSHHSGMDAWEIIARENKRGLWRGKFIVPEHWRKGERLPGESN
jgi:endonuclease YncB( thermonuclease family)